VWCVGGWAAAEKGALGSMSKGSCGRAKLGCRVAQGGVECELSAGWRGVRNGVLAERGALGSPGELWRCRGRAMGWHGGISQCERGAGWHGMRSGETVEGGALGMRAVAAAGLWMHGAGWRGVAGMRCRHCAGWCDC
jgi:hypothetical protein